MLDEIAQLIEDENRRTQALRRRNSLMQDAMISFLFILILVIIRIQVLALTPHYHTHSSNFNFPIFSSSACGRVSTVLKSISYDYCSANPYLEQNSYSYLNEYNIQCTHPKGYLIIMRGNNILSKKIYINTFSRFYATKRIRKIYFGKWVQFLWDLTVKLFCIVMLWNRA